MYGYKKSVYNKKKKLKTNVMRGKMFVYPNNIFQHVKNEKNI